jgi:hypothetical protein
MNHIPGAQNKVADSLSRMAASGDYCIKKEVLNKIMDQLGLPVWLDAFATRINKRLNAYCSLLPDKGAFEVNAYRVDWKITKPYLHPPIN